MNDMAQSASQSMSLTSAFGTSILGFSIVFFVLVVLMIMITILRSVVETMGTGASAPAAVAVPAAAAPAPKADMIPAKGSLGEIKLHNVDDKTAALIMAIVADKIGAPLNELRFYSISEKK